jgi:hypothetical protein
MCDITWRRFVATIIAMENQFSVTYSESVSVALVIQMHPIVICSLSGSTIYFPYFLTKVRLSEKLYR